MHTFEVQHDQSENILVALLSCSPQAVKQKSNICNAVFKAHVVDPVFSRVFFFFTGACISPLL